MFGENDIEKLFLKEEYGKVVKSDYAIVLGCDTQGAVARADMAANFYFKGGAEKLIVSGGVERDYKGGKAPECAIMRDRLLFRGVPDSAITEEKRATDTIENMVGGLMEICQSSSVLKVRKVTIITEPYHVPRSVLTAKIFLPPYMQVFGYTENTEKDLAEAKEKFIREIGLLNWVIGDSGTENAALIAGLIK